MFKTILILDSSQIDTFLTCPTFWHYQYAKRLLPAAMSINVPMNMGTYGHKLFEIIYKERARGNRRNAIDIALAYDIDKETCRCGHSHDNHLNVASCIIGPGDDSLDFKRSELEKLSPIAPLNCNSVGCKCDEFVGIEFPLNKVDRQSVRDRVIEYTMVEGTAIPELIAKSPEHVEVGFSHKLYEDDERLYILEGRIDLLGQIASNCENGWADHKFQVREKNLYLKSIQFRNYALATSLCIGVVNYVRFAKKIEAGKTFKRDIISFSRAEMRAWERNLIATYRKVEKAFVADDWYNVEDEYRTRSSCKGMFGYPCDYTPLCDEFFMPQLIKIKEGSDFVVKPEWRPW